MSSSYALITNFASCRSKYLKTQYGKQQYFRLVYADLKNGTTHYSDVIMSAMAYQITSLTVVYSIGYSGAEKYQSSGSLAFVRRILRLPVNSRQKGPVTRQCFGLMTSSWLTFCYLGSSYYHHIVSYMHPWNANLLWPIRYLYMIRHH